MRVSTDKKTTRESVVLEKNLVDDTRAGLPETNVVLGASAGKEVVNFLVNADGAVKILLATDLGLDQVIAVDGGRVGDLVHTGTHELENGHLGGGILASNAIGTELEVRATTLNVLAVRVVQVRVENLLGVRERAVETAANDGEVLGHLLVVDEVVLLPVVLTDLCSGQIDMVSELCLVLEAIAREPRRRPAELEPDARLEIDATQIRVKRTLRSRGESETVAMRRMPDEAAPPTARLRATLPRTCLVASMTGERELGRAGGKLLL